MGCIPSTPHDILITSEIKICSEFDEASGSTFFETPNDVLLKLRSFGESNDSFHDIYDLTRDEVLGHGGFASVFVATHRTTNKKVAVKCFDKTTLNPEDIDDLFEEVSILQTIDHDGIVHMIDFFDEEANCFIVLNLVPGGDLLDRLGDRRKFTEHEVQLLVRNLLKALNYLHSKKIAHRDLKLENILLASVDDDTTIKLCDFGFARRVSNQLLFQPLGSPDYMAPEMISGFDYGCEVDIWSVGVITYVLLCGYMPFWGESKQELFQVIQSGEFEFHSTYWGEITPMAEEFISRMLVVDQKDRATVNELLAHPWLTKCLDSHWAESPTD